MKKTIKTSTLINASPESVWNKIRRGEAVNKWLPMVTECRLEGEGIGAKRVCTTEQGDLNETILIIDEENKIFQYAINEQPLFPIENVIGTMTLFSKGKHTILNWDLDFTLSDESHFETIKQAIEGMYAAGAKGLENISK